MDIKYVINELGRVHRFFRIIFSQNHTQSLDLPINSTQQKVLMFIKYHEVNTMSQISSMIGLEKGSFTTSVDHLIKLNLVKRSRLHSDRRSITLTLTEKGKSAAEEIIKAVDKEVEGRFEVLDEKEKEAFIHALQVISKCIDKMACKEIK